MDSHLETELLAYLDGELSEREQARVEAHLAECPRCAAELERLQDLQQDLGATFEAALGPLHLPRDADRRIRERLRARAEPGPLMALWQRRGLFVQAALTAMVLVVTLITYQTLRIPAVAAPQETLVLGQDQLAPGSQAALRVLVRSTADAQPVADAEVTVQVGRTPGLASIVYTGRTDASGTADVAFTVPDNLEGQASLIVETASAAGKDRIVRPITIQRDYKLFLSPDKPAYRPGQTIHMRALALDAVSLKPIAEQEVAFIVLGPNGERLAQETTLTSDFGVASLDVTLAADTARGQVTLRAVLGDTVSERTVTVDEYELPAFRVALETEHSFYAPGDRVTGDIQAAYFFGKPVANGRVTLRGYTGEGQAPAIIVQGRTDEDGAFDFAFVLPPDVGQSAKEQPALFALEAEVMDAAGQAEGIRHPLPVAAQPLLIDAVPEGGTIKPGIENTVFILTSYPDGQPAETTLSVRVAGEERTLATGPYGLAELRYVPEDSVAPLEVHARDAQGLKGTASFTFRPDRAEGSLLLRPERAVYEVGDTLRAEALVADGAIETIYLDVIHARQTIATLSAPVEDGRATFALDLDGAMVGTLELHAYYVGADGDVVRSTRLVVVDMARQVAVDVTADRDQYRPGDTARLTFRTTIASTQQPVQSALGVGVVDESVYALETLPPSFARAYFLLGQRLAQERVQSIAAPDLLDAEDVAARAAWADVPGSDFTLSARSTAAEPEEGVAARATLSNGLSIAVILLPLLLSAAVVQGLRPTGVLGQALRRAGIGGLALLVASPLLALVMGGAMWLMWTALGVGAPLVVLALTLALLIGLIVHGWRRPDVRVQLATGLLVAYLALGGLLVYLAARGSDPSGALLILIAATFLLLVAALAVLGQGLVLEGWRRAGWATTGLALLLIPLVIYLPFVPGAASDLTRALGDPALYAGPVGWLTGCAAQPTPEAGEEPTEMPEEEAVEEEAEEIAPTAAPTQAPAATAPSLPTATPAAAEPFPLRQVFPETLYWNAEALTDEDGRLRLDIPMADTITTWRLTALASTREGEIGVATYDLAVFQDFFVDLELPSVIRQGETVTATVTLYNYSEQAQTVQLALAPADWYDLVAAPEAITLPPNDLAAAQFLIRAERAGDFSLQVTAEGQRTSDAVARDVVIEP